MKEARDTTFMGPLSRTRSVNVTALAEMMPFWTFSDVFEEYGGFPNPFRGDFGLQAEGGINKPSYYGFALLHQLGRSAPGQSFKKRDRHHAARLAR